MKPRRSGDGGYAKDDCTLQTLIIGASGNAIHKPQWMQTTSFMQKANRLGPFPAETCESLG